MNKKQTTTYFDADEFKAWLASKGHIVPITTKNKVTNAVELAKLNLDKVGFLQLTVAEFLKENLDGPTPPTSA